MLGLFISLVACTMAPTGVSNDVGGENNDSMTDSLSGTGPLGDRIRIRVGSATFTATLLPHATAAAFKARLPLTITMSELNNNEKFAQLPNSLPINASNPGTIQTGDLMLYGSTTLVLFYKTFPTAYSYTRLGRIDNPSGLAAALGPGSATVTFGLD